MMSRFLRLALLTVLLALTTSCAKKADPAEAAKQFFALIANGQSHEAYESTSLAFKSQQSEQRFIQTTRELRLTEFLSMTNPPPVIEGNTATIDAQVSSKEGQKAPLSVTLVDERGAWRIFAVRAPRSVATGAAGNFFGVVGKGAAFLDGQQNPIPNDAEQRALVESTLLLFDECVKARSFDVLYAEVAKAWQEQLTEGKLRRAFQAFIDKQTLIGHIKDQTATFAEHPGINSEGLLVLRGFYAGEPNNVLFSMKFMYEAPKWRLFGLDVSLAKALGPSAEEIPRAEPGPDR